MDSTKPCARCGAPIPKLPSIADPTYCDNAEACELRLDIMRLRKENEDLRMLKTRIEELLKR